MKRPSDAISGGTDQPKMQPRATADQAKDQPKKLWIKLKKQYVLKLLKKGPMTLGEVPKKLRKK